MQAMHAYMILIIYFLGSHLAVNCCSETRQLIYFQQNCAANFVFVNHLQTLKVNQAIIFLQRASPKLKDALHFSPNPFHEFSSSCPKMLRSKSRGRPERGAEERIWPLTQKDWDTLQSPWLCYLVTASFMPSLSSPAQM